MNKEFLFTKKFFVLFVIYSRGRETLCSMVIGLIWSVLSDLSKVYILIR